MNKTAELFKQINEPFASGFFEDVERGRFYRFAKAQKRYWENRTLSPYNGGNLYPCGRKNADSCSVMPMFSYTYSYNRDLLKQKNPELEKLMTEETALMASIPPPHTVGGSGYTHSIPNYIRIIKEGFDSYVERINKIEDNDIREGLLELVDGIRTFRARSLEMLKKEGAPAALCDALEKVPFKPAETLYEALVAWNFIYYIDDCDNPGRLDAWLIDYYKGEDVTDIIREFFLNVDANDGWSGALGPDYNELTIQCLHAIKGIRRPSIELRITDDMPDEVWEAAAEAIACGGGSPSLYNEKAYQAALEKTFPDIPKEDLLQFNGGGCTETMLAGISNVGSLDAGLNVAIIFGDYMREKLVTAKSFDEFYDGLVGYTHEVTKQLLHDVNVYRKSREEVRPNPVRTLLIDDCIDKGLDFNGGGARYYWSVINVAGLINVIDSLLAIRELIFDKKEFGAEDFLMLLDKQDPEFLKKLSDCPCYGVDDETADKLATEFSTRVFEGFKQDKPYLGKAFLPSSIQFTTFVDAGKPVLATPDGRAAGEPLCDSIGPVHGKDVKGATAMLNSVARLNQSEALGTPVLNLRLRKEQLTGYLKPLILGYFEQGGMQVQVSCVSHEELLDAVEHPEKHRNLIVRIGGYSEYFNNLTDELQQQVIKRTEYGA